MPDRAVVESDTGLYVQDDKDIRVLCDVCGEYSKPRALVALSDDRQWLVVLDPCYNTPARWKLFRRKEYAYYAALRENQIEDTGQDAQQVLAAWLERRG